MQIEILKLAHLFQMSDFEYDFIIFHFTTLFGVMTQAAGHFMLWLTGHVTSFVFFISETLTFSRLVECDLEVALSHQKSAGK